MRTVDIHWLAGLLEGEGCFTRDCRGGPVVQINMTDRDIVERARHLFGVSPQIRTQVMYADSHKDLHKLAFSGRRAVEWMMTLYSLMGERRRSKIRELLVKWRSKPRRIRRFS